MAFAHIEPSERSRLARLGSVLFMVGSLTAVPAGLFLEPAPKLHEHAISATGFLLGVILFRLPWARMPSAWLHVFPVVGSVIVMAGVAVFSVVFSFFFVLAGMFVAISVRPPVVFGAYMGFLTLALFLPFIYSGDDAGDLAPTIFATLPVLLAVSFVSRYIYNVVESQRDQYRYFATQAMALAERIRGERERVREDSAESLEERLDDLTRSGAGESGDP